MRACELDSVGCISRRALGEDRFVHFTRRTKSNCRLAEGGESVLRIEGAVWCVFGVATKMD
jgi:hypothetical protein